METTSLQAGREWTASTNVPPTPEPSFWQRGESFVMELWGDSDTPSAVSPLKPRSSKDIQLEGLAGRTRHWLDSHKEQRAQLCNTVTAALCNRRLRTGWGPVFRQSLPDCRLTLQLTQFLVSSDGAGKAGEPIPALLPPENPAPDFSQPQFTSCPLTPPASQFALGEKMFHPAEVETQPGRQTDSLTPNSEGIYAHRTTARWVFKPTRTHSAKLTHHHHKLQR